MTAFALISGSLLAISTVAMAQPSGNESGVKHAKASVFGRTMDMEALWQFRFRRTYPGHAQREAAVARGFRWLARRQQKDGRWRLDSGFPDAGQPNDVAATAFGLLPIVAMGKTHQPSKDNPYDSVVGSGLQFLLREQARGTSGCFGGGMFAHAFATMAVCRLYELSKDPELLKPAQAAVDFVVTAQHGGGGWRYQPGQPGDMSVTAMQVLALHSARQAGLEVPTQTWTRVSSFLDSVCDPATEGYGYTSRGAFPSTTVMALVCRHFVEGWTPAHPRFQKAFRNHIGKREVNHNSLNNYFMTLLLDRFDGKEWSQWRDGLTEFANEQSREKEELNHGCWLSWQDTHTRFGGRLMHTSLMLLCLDVSLFRGYESEIRAAKRRR